MVEDTRIAAAIASTPQPAPGQAPRERSPGGLTCQARSAASASSASGTVRYLTYSLGTICQKCGNVRLPVMQQHAPHSGWTSPRHGAVTRSRADRLPMRRADPLPDQRVGVEPHREGGVRVVDERHAAGEAGAEIVADLAEHHDGAAGHVFAAIGAAAFDDRDRPRVADREPLARLPGREQLAGCRAVQQVLPMIVFSLLRSSDDGGGRTTIVAPDKPLADVVVRVARALRASGPARAKAPSDWPAEPRSRTVRWPGCKPGHAEAPGDLGRYLGADRAVRVPDRVLRAASSRRARTARAASAIICASSVSGTSLRPSSVQ